MKDIKKYLEDLDAWLEGDSNGVVPLDLLRGRGMEIPPPNGLDDDALAAKLVEIFTALASIGMFFHSTDHLSDRELYQRLVTDVLTKATSLSPDDPAAGEHYDFAAAESEEDSNIYLTYYAGDEERDDWHKDFPDEPLPERRTPPHDRDRLLPTQEGRYASARETS